mmetsp:Transcript_23783/g.33982  ORF Transcript_23783/g.33982 Transcript_23783/m.33982 type:complete len:138 (+) Transcript_23783:152-565(+)
MVVQLEIPVGSSESEQDKLTINVKGFDKILTLESKIKIPIEHIESIRYAEKTIIEDRRRLGMSRAVGFRYGKQFIVGTFVEWDRNKVVFWNIHNKKAAVYGNVIVVVLKNERYNELVLEVDDSERVMAELRRVTAQT